MIRLGLAGIVAGVHAMEIGFGTQPVIGSAQVGDLAVDAFFVLSGFLVARSYLRLDSVRRFSWHRFLRIMPGFWACLAVTAFVLAPIAAVLSGRLPWSVFTGPESSWSYLQANAALMMRQFGISGLPDTPHVPGVFDGALWTLFYEAACYGLLAGLGICGVLTRRIWVLGALIALLWALVTADALTAFTIGPERIVRFALVFLLGAAAHLAAHRIVISVSIAITCALITIASLYLLPDYRAAAAPAFAYLWIYAAVRLPLRQNPRRDLSYGLYIYHWPIEQLLVILGATALTALPFISVSLALALIAAVASWNLVEAPALQFKDAAWVEGKAARRPGRHVADSRLSG